MGEGLTAGDMSLQMLLAREGLSAVGTENLSHRDVGYRRRLARRARMSRFR